MAEVQDSIDTSTADVAPTAGSALTNPGASHNNSLNGFERVEITWANTLRIWWSYCWRCLLYTIIFGAIAGLLAGIVVGVMGKGPNVGGLDGGTIGGILGYLVSIPISIIVLKDILEKKYRPFVIALVKERPEA